MSNNIHHCGLFIYARIIVNNNPVLPEHGFTLSVLYENLKPILLEKAKAAAVTLKGALSSVIQEGGRAPTAAPAANGAATGVRKNPARAPTARLPTEPNIQQSCGPCTPVQAAPAQLSHLLK
jgi:hypothetical protein